MIQQNKVRQLTISAILLTVLIICSQLVIPFPVIPITLQTLAVGLIATLLPMNWSTLTIITYLLMGAVGLPVFSGFNGGLAVLVSSVGGYLFGFLVYVWIVGMLFRYNNWNWWTVSYINFIASLAQLLVGSVWIMFTQNLSLSSSLVIGTLPFIIPAIIKIAIIVPIALRMKKIMN